MISVRVEALSKRHGNLQVLENFSLSIRKGELVSIVGPSGCGKTTLLRLIQGLETQDSGRILFEDEDPKIGMVFQTPRLLPWRTVGENLTLALGTGSHDEILDSLMRRVDLPDAISLYPDQLSIGMMRRVALVRAFAIRPRLLLMDEPLVSLDQATARKVRALLLELWASDRQTILFVTHDLREAIEISDRIIFVSASPMQVMGETVIDLPREKRDSEAIENLLRKIEEAPMTR